MDLTVRSQTGSELLHQTYGVLFFSLAELTKEMTSLKNGLTEVQREIDFLRAQAEPIPEDKFVPVMKNFVASATYKYQELDELFVEMKSKYSEVVRLFGEDPSSVQPDEFFSIFDAFLTSFNDAKNEIDSIQKRRKEEMERQKELEVGRIPQMKENHSVPRFFPLADPFHRGGFSDEE